MSEKVKYRNVSHLDHWLKDVKIQKYTDEEYHADLTKWAQDTKYSKRQTKCIEEFQKCNKFYADLIKWVQDNEHSTEQTKCTEEL